MKKDLFKVRLFSLAGLFGFMLTLASCANEEVVQKATNPDNDNNKNLTTFSTISTLRMTTTYGKEVIIPLQLRLHVLAL